MAVTQDRPSLPLSQDELHPTTMYRSIFIRSTMTLLCCTVVLGSLSWAKGPLAINSPAKVHIMRSTGYAGSLDGYSIFMDGQRICVLNNKSRSIHEVPPGEHRFTIRANGKREHEKAEVMLLTVASGQDYYLMVEQTQGFWRTFLTLQELTPASGQRMLGRMQHEDTCEE